MADNQFKTITLLLEVELRPVPPDSNQLDNTYWASVLQDTIHALASTTLSVLRTAKLYPIEDCMDGTFTCRALDDKTAQTG